MEQKQSRIDFSYYVAKFGVPLWERKVLIVLILLLGIIVALTLGFFIEEEFVSNGKLLVEKPRTEFAKAKDEEQVAPEGAPGSYVLAQTEKLKSSSFAMEVLQILPSVAREELEAQPGIFNQLRERMSQYIPSLAQKDTDTEEVPESGPMLEAMQRNSLSRRMDIVGNARTGMIDISAMSFDREVAPILVRSYIDVFMATTMEENKESIRSKMKFAKRQRDQTYAAYKHAEQEMIDFRKEYGIPGDFDRARDINIQLELNRLRAQMEMAKERYLYMDQMQIQIERNEAGITNNVKVIEGATLPVSPTAARLNQFRLMIILAALALGLALVLGLDFLQGKVRHEKDVQAVLNIPIFGYLPKNARRGVWRWRRA